ncbi:MAG: biopolymer transporter ExbD [Pseudomonadota bacterium]
MFEFAAPRTRRKPSLTPMIDVVFLLLVFFMLAAQFGREGALNLSGASGASAYEGPPRLITVLPDALLLNGSQKTEEALLGSLSNLTRSQNDAIVLQAREGANVQRLSDVAYRLTAAGFTRLILIE